MNESENLDHIYHIIDVPLRKLRPNYGYVEVYVVAYEILRNNDYLLPKDDHILELFNSFLDQSNGKIQS